MEKEKAWLLKEKYSGVESPEYFTDCKRLESGEPLAYVIGWVDFLGCRINLDAHPLIPRPETEFWVEAAISQIPTERKIKILDLFAGSGCIGVALAKLLPHATVDFGEIDSTLAAQIQENIRGNNVDPSRTRIITTNIFSHISDSYDYIFANPPYIDPARYDTVDKSVFLHEPHSALFAKDSGLALIKNLITHAKEHLATNGVLFVEFGEGQKERLEKFIEKFPFIPTWNKDAYGRWRVLKLVLR